MNYDAAGLLDKARLAAGFRPSVFVTFFALPHTRVAHSHGEKKHKDSD